MICEQSKVDNQEVNYLLNNSYAMNEYKHEVFSAMWYKEKNRGLSKD